MPNRRKTLEELEMSGTLAKNKKRYTGLVAAANGFMPLGEPPAQLDAREADAWRDLQARAVPGTLAQGDYVLMILASRLTAKLLWQFDAMTDKDKSTLQSVVKDLGMAPITRGRITPVKETPPPGKPATPFEIFMAHRVGAEDREERKKRLRAIGDAAIGRKSA